MSHFSCVPRIIIVWMPTVVPPLTCIVWPKLFNLLGEDRSRPKLFEMIQKMQKVRLDVPDKLCRSSDWVESRNEQIISCLPSLPELRERESTKPGCITFIWAISFFCVRLLQRRRVNYLWQNNINNEFLKHTCKNANIKVLVLSWHYSQGKLRKIKITIDRLKS